jgi:glc operon protein GlcG
MSVPAPIAAPPAYGPPITLAEAKAVLAAAEAEANAHGWPLTLAIVDSGANLVALHRMDNASLGSPAIAQAKAETAVKFRRETKVMQDNIAAGGLHLRILAMPGVTPLEGGVPLFAHGAIIGAIGVSGMASGQDAQVAHAGAKALAANV